MGLVYTNPHLNHVHPFGSLTKIHIFETYPLSEGRLETDPDAKSCFVVEWHGDVDGFEIQHRTTK